MFLNNEENEEIKEMTEEDFLPISTNNNFAAKPLKNENKFSFYIHSFKIINGNEIMNLIFKNKFFGRFMKFNYKGMAYIKFDIQGENYLLNPDEIFATGQGISAILFEEGLVTQWELIKIDLFLHLFSRGFLSEFLDFISDNKIKLTQEAKNYLEG